MQQARAPRGMGEVVNGRYLIRRKLGAGAMGTVFLAQDAMLQQEVALKYLLWNPNHQEAVAAFKTEFATLTQLHHPHITRVYDLAQDTESAHYFFASELVTGQNFFDAVAQWSPQDCERLLLQALRALEYLHQHNIYHFDIKPQNVLVTTAPGQAADPATSVLKLIDFGLASVGFQNKLVGTPSYIAPEVIKREFPDQRADLYSLGVLLYYALARYNPFRAPSREETFQRHLTLPPPPLRQFRPDIPAYLHDLVMKLLAKPREERYATATQAIADLQRASPDPEISLLQPEITQQGWEGAFVGRAEILDQLEAHLAACAEGRPDRPPCIGIVGPPGTGKSRLVQEFKFKAQLAGFATHTVNHADIAARMAWLAALDSAEEDPSQPIIFFLDDLDRLIETQAANEIVQGIKRLLRSIRTQLELPTGTSPTRVLVVATGSERRTFGPLLTQALALPAAIQTIIPLQNFSLVEFQLYLQAISAAEIPAPNLLQELHHHTGGNPLCTIELFKQLSVAGQHIVREGRWQIERMAALGATLPTGPASLATLAQREFFDLAPEAQELLRHMAIWGEPITEPQLRHVLTTAWSRETLTQLLHRELLMYDPTVRQYRFRSETKRGLLLEQLRAEQRQALHDRAATVVATDPDGRVERLYYHRLHGRGPQDDEVVLWELAQTQLAADQLPATITSLAALVALTPEIPGHTAAIGTRMLLAQCYREHGDFAAANALYASLHALVGDTPAGRQRLLQLYQAIGRTAAQARHWEAAATAWQQALRLLDEMPQCHVERLIVANDLAGVALERGEVAHAIAEFQRTAEAATHLLPEEQARITNHRLGAAYAADGRWQPACAQLSQELSQWQASGRARLAAQTRYQRALVYAQLAREREQAAAELMAAAQEAHACGDMAQRARALLALYQIDPAPAHLQTAHACCPHIQDPALIAEVALRWGEAQLHTAPATAEASLQHALALVTTHDLAAPALRCQIHLGLAQCYLQQQAWERAAYQARTSYGLAMRHAQCRAWQLPSAQLAASIARQLGETERAVFFAGMADRENTQDDARERRSIPTQ